MSNNHNEFFPTIPNLHSNILDFQNCSQNGLEEEKTKPPTQFKCSLIEIPDQTDPNAFFSYFLNAEDPQLVDFFKKQRNSIINFSKNSLFNLDTVHRPTNPIFRQIPNYSSETPRHAEESPIFQNLWISKKNIFENENSSPLQSFPPKSTKRVHIQAKNDLKLKERVNCHCKKSKCLRLYCECFAKGLICGVDCDCEGCGNNDELKELRELVVQETIEKNPFAFKSKYKTLKEDKTVLHSRGCNCSKTGCVKKYCECYNAGTGCSRLCKCSNCKNENIELKDSDVRVYYDRVLRKRSKKSVLQKCFEGKSNVLSKIKQI